MSLPRHSKVSLELVRKIKSYCTINVIAPGLHLDSYGKSSSSNTSSVSTSESWSNSKANKKGKKGKESAGFFFFVYFISSPETCPATG